MDRIYKLLGMTLVVVALAAPAFAQPADPYGEVLPGGAERPTDVVAPPDDGAVAPGEAVAPPGADRTTRGADRAPGVAVSPAPGLVTAGTVVAVPDAVTVAGRQLPVTGGELTITLLVLGAAMVAGGAGAVALARRRAAAPQH